MKCFFSVFCLGFALISQPANGAMATAEDLYVRVYDLIENGDSLAKAGKGKESLQGYLQAQAELQKFHSSFPDWNPTLVNYRLKYLDAKISPLRKKYPTVKLIPLPLEETPTAANTTPVTSETSVPGLANTTPEASSDQIKQYQAEITHLQAKLREALAVQPAVNDPRELSRSEEKVSMLQKENDVLRTSFKQLKDKPGKTDPLKLVETEKTLAETNQKLSEQTEKATSLEKENAVLSKRLAELMIEIQALKAK
jgi:hypothetical protein